MVTLHKVEGHSDDYWNNKADELANGGSQIKDPIIKWSDTAIQPIIFNSMINNISFKLIEQSLMEDIVDWSFTREWINTNPLDTPCSAKLSKIQGNKIKKLNFAHPTIDIQQRNYPRLYPRGIIPCVECNSAKDNNEHIGLCTAHTTIITQLISDASDILLTLMLEETAEQNYALRNTIKESKLFDISFELFLFKDHPFYLLIHHLVPKDLTDIFYNYIPKKKKRFEIFIKFMNIIMANIDAHIWTLLKIKRNFIGKTTIQIMIVRIRTRTSIDKEIILVINIIPIFPPLIIAVVVSLITTPIFDGRRVIFYIRVLDNHIEIEFGSI
ncbi:hypothetical protein RhiirA5_425197 [Rhizophagus irregularis]|uniref:RNase H type-1 domain-containing protein n=1 Tax=Rhizophagus irregularis TaxID=588596 RepID=A0A2N0P6M9_9GLOM|nr:hypothetical protein RhiirA5_425197 [Rhizophagus irregularis]